MDSVRGLQAWDVDLIGMKKTDRFTGEMIPVRTVATAKNEGGSSGNIKS